MVSVADQDPLVNEAGIQNSRTYVQADFDFICSSMAIIF